jgi:hypothetical protein
MNPDIISSFLYLVKFTIGFLIGRFIIFLLKRKIYKE